MAEVNIVQFCDYFEKILPKICQKDTSFHPQGWTENNPLWGHCAVVSLLAAGLVRGDILQSSLAGTKFASMQYHYWNLFPNGEQKDFTRAQFGGEYPSELEIKTVGIAVLTGDIFFMNRFTIFLDRFIEECKKNC